MRHGKINSNSEASASTTPHKPQRHHNAGSTSETIFKIAAQSAQLAFTSRSKVVEDNGIEAESTNRRAPGCGMRRRRRRRTWAAVSRRQQHRQARQLWAHARPPRGRCRGGRTSPAPMSTPPRYLKTTQRKHPIRSQIPAMPGRILRPGGGRRYM
jgi:hypothetical protein